jgi:hypothetical protein
MNSAALSVEAATLECKKRNVNTAAVKEALKFLESHILPGIPQFRSHLNRDPELEVDKGQQQVLWPTFEGIRKSVYDLVGKQMDALAQKFAVTQDMKVKEEIERLSIEVGKLKEPWRFMTR